MSIYDSVGYVVAGAVVALWLWNASSWTAWAVRRYKNYKERRLEAAMSPLGRQIYERVKAELSNPAWMLDTECDSFYGLKLGKLGLTLQATNTRDKLIGVKIRANDNIGRVDVESSLNSADRTLISQLVRQLRVNICGDFTAKAFADKILINAWVARFNSKDNKDKG